MAIIRSLVAISVVGLLPLACSSNNAGGNSGPSGSGGHCSIPVQFDGVGMLGIVDYILDPTTGQYTYDNVTAYVADYELTCGGANTPPDYAAQSANHIFGFSLHADSLTSGMTVTYPGPNEGPNFGDCGVGAEAGGNGPVNECLGGSYACVNGSTVTLTAISKSSASGSYDLILNDGNGPNVNISGSFSFSGNCSQEP